MVRQDIIEEYHDWLCEMMRCDLPEHRNYEHLLHYLGCKTYIWLHPMDENRDIDALNLRKEFYFDHGYNVSDVFDGPRSVLEVLVALSRRIEIEIMGEPGNDHIERWFWIMISNLGLDSMRNDMYDPYYVDHQLDIWLNRKYNSYGKGGIFPLKKLTSDQRVIDTWYQMQAYLNENYQF